MHYLFYNYYNIILNFFNNYKIHILSVLKHLSVVGYILFSEERCIHKYDEYKLYRWDIKTIHSQVLYDEIMKSSFILILFLILIS